MGYAKQWSEGGRVVFESDTTWCRHCERSLFVGRVPKGVNHEIYQREGGYCMRCAGPLCGPCAKKLLTGVCESAKRRVDEQLSRLAVRQNL